MNLGLLAALALAGYSGPAGVEWVTDSTVNPPGVLGEFFIEQVPPLPCGGLILYNGSRLDDPALNVGLYAASLHSVSVIADGNTPVTAGGATLPIAVEQACDAERVAFVGLESGPGGVAGLYEWRSGETTRLLAIGAPLVGSTLTGFAGVSVDRGDMVLDATLFPAVSSQVLLLLPSTGIPSLIADRTTVLPGQAEPVTIFADPVLDDTGVVFHARTDAVVGFYRWSADSGIDLIVDTATPVPVMGGGNFGIFDTAAAIVDQGVVFGAGYFGGYGLFLAAPGGLAPLVLPGDVTEGGETLISASLPTGRGSFVAFIGRTVERPQQAVYVRFPDGRLSRVLGGGDVVDGRTIDSVRAGADDRTVAIRTDSFGPPWIQSVYRARIVGANAVEIPSVSPLGLAMLGLCLGAAGVILFRAKATSRSLRNRG